MAKKKSEKQSPESKAAWSQRQAVAAGRSVTTSYHTAPKHFRRQGTPDPS